MRQIFGVNQSSNGIHFALLFVRVAFGAMMLTHGLPKMEMLLSGNGSQFPPVMGFSPEISLALAVFAEVICATLVIIGLGTRVAVIPLIITMAVAVFMIHAADPFTQKEMASLYLAIFTGLLFTGSGKYSIDYLVQPKGKKAVANRSVQDPTLAVYQ
ncbi:DoxX family protein [Flavisolibacter sp. BT320]|nr:DoxX family protein [Flavisolibacter longurius]